MQNQTSFKCQAKKFVSTFVKVCGTCVTAVAAACLVLGIAYAIYEKHPMKDWVEQYGTEYAFVTHHQDCFVDQDEDLDSLFGWIESIQVRQRAQFLYASNALKKDDVREFVFALKMSTTDPQIIRYALSQKKMQWELDFYIESEIQAMREAQEFAANVEHALKPAVKLFSVIVAKAAVEAAVEKAAQR